jgi:glucose-1-phosphate adenylyltransferase
MTLDENDRIVKFSEKPKDPDSNMASMGIYIFSWDVLRKALKEDNQDETSEKDFGKNIIPKLLEAGKRLFAYHFDGYWKDVGTIDSYYSSQMELLEKDAPLNIFERSMHIFSNSNNSPSSFIGENAHLKNSLVCNGCGVFGSLEHSILGVDAVVHDGSVIKDSIILPGADIGRNCRITKAIVNENVVIPDGTVIGSEDGEITVVGKSL